MVSLTGTSGPESVPSSVDVVVVGGGVIGCSVAWHLAGEGVRVALLERDRVGSHASSGAAGMLAPQVEADGPGDFLDLGVAARDAFPAWAAALEEETGVDVECRMDGILRVTAQEEEADRLRQRERWQRAAGLRAQWLDGDEVRRRMPSLGPVLGALWVPDGQVSAPRLVRALAEGAARRGARLVEGTPVLGLERAGDRVTGVRTTAGTVSAGAVVLAAGPWSGGWAELPLPVRPVRGQIVRLAALPRPVDAVLFADDCYLVPKQPDRIWVGATVEHVGFDERATAAGVAGLLAAAVRLVPALGAAAVASCWAGLRPGSPDGNPVLGPAPGIEGLYLATGHFRNGILLAGVTGQLVADLVLGRQPRFDWRPFGAGRFAAAA